MGLKILISGGLGFLGHHLCRRLLKAYPDCDLTLVDNLSSSLIDPAWLEGRARIRIEDFATADLRGLAFDRIYHLASPVGSLGILDQAGTIAKQITDLAARAGEIAAATGAFLLYVSSSEIYGKGGLQDEDDELSIPTRPGARMEYLLGKLAGEHLLRNLAVRRGFRLTLARPFNIMGEHQTSRIGFVVPTFFERALAGEALPLFYGGGQIRCFCHAEDMAEGLIAVQERGGNGQVYNLGNPGNAIRIADLASRIRNLCGSDSALETVDPEARFGSGYLEASAKLPAIGKAAAHTGWVPRIGLDGALEKTYRHYLETQEGRHAEYQDRILVHPDRLPAGAA